MEITQLSHFFGEKISSWVNETQKEMRQKYDPYYWAAFVLIE